VLGATAPQLGVAAPFAAPPLLISGTDAYRDGEYLCQDYLFDDRRRRHRAFEGSERANTATFSPSAGDVLYPTACR
jgi:hypothetical protein